MWNRYIIPLHKGRELMKKILYVAPLVAGFQDILEGKLDSRGLPSFILPLKAIQESDNCRADIVLISNFTKDYNINVNWISEENIVANINNDLTAKNKLVKVYRKIKSSLQLITVLMKVTKNGAYDVIYCHGKAAVWGNIISLIRKIPCAYRLYGTASFYDDLDKLGRIKGAIKNPIYTLIFKLPKKFLMITDDGSRGDEVYQLMKPKSTKYSFHFLLNGVDFQKVDSLDQTIVPKNEKYIFHAGRIDQVKRQDRNIEVLRELRESGHDIKLYLAGHYDENTNYYKYLIELIAKYKLENYVIFMGPIKREELKVLAYHSICTLLMGDIANNGNVFYEVFSTGSIVVGLRGNGLIQFIQHDINGYLVEDNSDAVETITFLLGNEESKIQEIKDSAIIASKSKLLDWDQRVQLELNLLMNK